MRTDLELIIDGINQLVSISPQLTPAGHGLITWEHTRDKALAALLEKLKESPFYAISMTNYPPDNDESDCDCDDCHDERLDNTDDFSGQEHVALLQRKIDNLEEAIGKHNLSKKRIVDALGNGCDEKMWPSNTHWADAACNVIKNCQGDAEAIASLSKKLNDARAYIETYKQGNAFLRVERDKYKKALEELSKLGGGNSDGNWIALQALKIDS